ncbi:MAG TPA: hypothetical protein VJT80_18750 [Steroidobacteraceae bacterium]|nr:hypothetical protein [Steroidobacteraceae bacterium]
MAGREKKRRSRKAAKGAHEPAAPRRLSNASAIQRLTAGDRARRRTPPRAALAQLHAQASAKWGAFATYLGRKKRHGRWTSEVALVCLVESKQPLEEIPKQQRIWKAAQWKERRRTYRIPTDVVAATPDLQLQQGVVLGPGDGAIFGAADATIGAAVDHPVFGRCLTTAGHLFGGPAAVGSLAQARASGLQFNVLVKRCVLQLAADYALLQPTNPADCDNLFRDRVRIGPVFVPTVADQNKPLFVLDQNGAVPTICRGVHARLNTVVGVFEDVILTTPVTTAGMSGAALVDSDSRLWGFLLGTFAGSSFFMPANLLLTQEGSRLA